MKTWRLSKKDRAAILDAYRAGEKIDMIAMKFGVASSYVSMLARRAGVAMRYPSRPRKSATKRGVKK